MDFREKIGKPVDSSIMHMYMLLSTVAHNCHGKIFILTAKSISPRQNHFRHGKINFATAKSISPRQNHFRHGQINFATAKSFSFTAK